MANRTRPSGTGSNSTRVATAKHPETGQEVQIPTARAVAVAFYVANADGSRPTRPALMIDHEVSDLTEGSMVQLEEMRQGRGMGNREHYRIAQNQIVLRRFSGKYGQMLREILLVPVASADFMGELHPSDLDGGD